MRIVHGNYERYGRVGQDGKKYKFRVIESESESVRKYGICQYIIQNIFKHQWVVSILQNLLVPERDFLSCVRR